MFPDFNKRFKIIRVRSLDTASESGTIFSSYIYTQEVKKQYHFPELRHQIFKRHPGVKKSMFLFSRVKNLI